MIIAGAIAGAGALGAAAIGSHAAKKAGETQSTAALQAAQLQDAAAQRAVNFQQNVFDTTRSDLAPYRGAGGGATNALLGGLGIGDGSGGTGGLPGWAISDQDYLDFVKNTPGLMEGYQANLANPDYKESLLDFAKRQLQDHPDAYKLGVNPLNSPLLKPFSMDQRTLEQTPGYRFNLSQGLKAVQNAAAARGLGASGAALKGASTFATGLADNTFRTQMDNYYTGQGNQFNRLLGLSSQGANAAAQTGNLGVQTGANVGNTLMGGAAAQAAGLTGAAQARASGTVGSANAISGGLGGLSNLFFANQLLGGALFGGSIGTGSSGASTAGMFGH
jgi:hypothetical protein